MPYLARIPVVKPVFGQEWPNFASLPLLTVSLRCPADCYSRLPPVTAAIQYWLPMARSTALNPARDPLKAIQSRPISAQLRSTHARMIQSRRSGPCTGLEGGPARPWRRMARRSRTAATGDPGSLWRWYGVWPTLPRRPPCELLQHGGLPRGKGPCC
jgi:hypothetical protein